MYFALLSGLHGTCVEPSLVPAAGLGCQKWKPSGAMAWRAGRMASKPWFGHFHLRPGTSEDLYQKSFASQKISSFWSHSWHGNHRMNEDHLFCQMRKTSLYHRWSAPNWFDAYLCKWRPFREFMLNTRGHPLSEMVTFVKVNYYIEWRF